MSSSYYFRCIKNPEHVIVMDLTEKAYRTTCRKFKKGLAVCPNCKPDNVAMEPCDPPETENPFGSHALAACRHGHTTKISAFSNGMLNVKWGEDDGQFDNIEGVPDELERLLDEKVICCYHTIERKSGWAPCNCKLKVVKGSVRTPSVIAIKTRTRVGDIWDKAKVAEPRRGDYDKDGNFRETEFDRRNKKRLRDMRSGKIEVYDDDTGRRKFVRRDRNTDAKGRTDGKPTPVDEKEFKTRRRPPRK